MDSYLDGLDGTTSGSAGEHDQDPHSAAAAGPLDLLINAIQNPSSAISSNAADHQHQQGEHHLADQNNDGLGDNHRPPALGDEHTYDPTLGGNDETDYGAAAEAAAAAYASGSGRGYPELTMLEEDHAEGGEHAGREASHSIQGLLAASKYLGGQQPAGEYVTEDQPSLPPSSAIGKRRATSPPHQDTPPRHGKIARLFAATTGPNGARIPEQSMSFSTITLLHGHVAQKSYGPEKRFLAPPPVVRMNGSVADTLETLTLALVNNDTGPLVPLISNVQGVHFDIPGRQDEARSMVRDGMGFPGLYASCTHKAKTIKLRLNVFQPGGTDWRVDAMGNLVLPEQIKTGEGLPESERVQPKLNRKKVVASGSKLKINAKEEGHHPQIEEPTGDANGDQRHFDDTVVFDISQGNAENQDGPLAAALHGGDMTMGDMTHDPDLTMNDATILEPDVGMMGEGTPGVDSPFGDEGDDQPHNDMVEDMNAVPDGHATRPWATFESEPLLVLSKPTKTTQKVRSLGPPLSITSTVALWSRINSQAVRTKYMLYERGRMIGRPSEWSAFVIDVIKRGSPPLGFESKHPDAHDESVLCYGSVVSIREKHSGLRTEPLLMCKVNSGVLELNTFDPVNQLEKIAFAKNVKGQGRWYLRAPGKAIKRFDEDGKPVPRIRKRQRGHKDLVNLVVKKKNAPALDQEATDDDRAVKFALPQIQVQEIDGQEIRSEYIDDFLCWSITGVAERTYTFFEGRHDLGDFSSVFKKPLTPLPTLLEEPSYRAHEHTVTLTVTDFYYDDDDINFRQKPLLVYLGAIGPLSVRTYRSSAPQTGQSTIANGTDGTSIDIASFPAIPTDGGEDIPPEERPYSSIPQSTPHSIIVVQLPSALDIWEATRIERERQQELDQLRGTEDEMMDIDDMAMFESLNFDVGPPTSTTQPAPVGESSMNGNENAKQEHSEIPPDQLDPEMQHQAYPMDEAGSQVNSGASDGENEAIPQDLGLDDGVDHAGPSGMHSTGLHESEMHLTNVDTSSLHDMGEHSDHQHHDQHDVMQQLLDPRLGDLSDMDDISGDYIASFEAAAAALTAAQEEQHLHDMHDMHNIQGMQGMSAAAAAAMLAPDTSLADVSAMHAEMLGGGNGNHSPMTGEHMPEQGTIDQRGYEPDASELGGAGTGKKGKGKGASAAQRKGRPPKPKPPIPVDENGKRIRKKRVLASKPVLVDNAHAESDPPTLRITDKAVSAIAKGKERSDDLGHSSLPLLFVRPSDGTGYHSGKNVVIEKLEAGGMEPEGWIIRVV